MCLSLTIAVASTMACGSAPSAIAAEALVQQGPKLTAGEAGVGYFGRDVALSADGATALIGAPHADGEAGAAFVLARSGSTWTHQAELTSGEAGVNEGHFGHSAALSADGDTAVVGAPTFDYGLGAVWVFTRSGTTWTLQEKLTGAAELGDGHFGADVALSADGNTAVIGAPGDDHDLGAAWVFTRSGSSWTQQAKLTGEGESGDGEFGRSAAVSSDGEALLIGAPCDDGRVGAAWAFSGSGSTWTQQGVKLTGGEEVGEARFGHSVALSSDGDTALVGGRDDNGAVGAAWAFTRAGSTWSQQGPKLTATSGEAGAGEFGYSVALAADGETALVGAMRDHGGVGAVWTLARSGSTWAQLGEKLKGGEETGGGGFGSSVALSGEAGVALVGGFSDDGRVGAAWAFATPEPPPSATTTPGAQPSTGSAPAPGPSPKQGVAAFKAAGGGVVLLSRTILVRGGRAAIRLRCTAPVTCRGFLTIAIQVRARAARRPRMIAIARVRFSVAHGRRATVMAKLDAVGHQSLSSNRGRLRARLTIHLSFPHRARHAYAVKLVRQRAQRLHRSVK